MRASCRNVTHQFTQKWPCRLCQPASSGLQVASSFASARAMHNLSIHEALPQSMCNTCSVPSGNRTQTKGAANKGSNNRNSKASKDNISNTMDSGKVLRKPNWSTDSATDSSELCTKLGRGSRLREGLELQPGWLQKPNIQSQTSNSCQKHVTKAAHLNLCCPWAKHLERS